jgi:hypothetical protein
MKTNTIQQKIAVARASATKSIVNSLISKQPTPIPRYLAGSFTIFESYHTDYLCRSLSESRQLVMPSNKQHYMNNYKQPKKH